MSGTREPHRRYTDREWSAMKRLGIAEDHAGGPVGGHGPGGPAIFAAGPWWLNKAQKNASDWAIAAQALAREFAANEPGWKEEE